METAPVMSNETEKKKGVPALAWVGIGCLVVAMVGVAGVSLLIGKCNATIREYADNPDKLAAKMAELAIKNDPNLDFVSVNESDRSITYRDKNSGKETTVKWDEFKDGKITVQSGESSATIDGMAGEVRTVTPDGTSTTTLGGSGGSEKLPKWFEVPEGIVDWSSVLRQEGADGKVSGSLVAKSDRPIAELGSAFAAALEKAGFVKEGRSESPNHLLLTYTDQAGERRVVVTLFGQAAHTGLKLDYVQR